MESGKNKTEHDPLDDRNDYLWDRSGNPDPEIQKLEATLGALRSNRPAPVFPASTPASRWSSFAWLKPHPAFAVLALASVVSFTIFLVVKPGSEVTPPLPAWEIASAEGNARIGDKIVTASPSEQLKVGQVLETDDRSRATIKADAVGQIEVEPDTRLRLISMTNGLKRIALDHGTIHAYIWSAPGEFVVDTPSAVTIDLGCAYSLHVDKNGAGIVRTSLGWVGFKLKGRESFIPAGAACATRPMVGPGTPYLEDASQTFRDALTRFDFTDQSPEQRVADLETILSDARKEDALTLWHLISRVDLDQRGRVYDRLAAFVSPPSTVTREGILRLDHSMLDAWWNQLGYDDIEIWRQFERSWAR